MSLKKHTIISYAVIVMTCCAFQESFSCGPGVVPYIPTQSGTGNSAYKEFFIIEKGVAATMFDIKKLQPLFRNVVYSGNERKETPYASKDQSEIMNGTKTGTEGFTAVDSLHTTMEPMNTKPILNIHLLH